MTDLTFATLWEAIASAVPDQPAVIVDGQVTTWAELETRAARLAAGLASYGLRHDSKLALYLHNTREYVETQFAGFKLRAVPVNANYRYLDDELVYLLDNCDAEAVVFDGRLADRIDRVRTRAPKVKAWIGVGDSGAAVDGAVGYEELLAAHDPAPPIERSGDDVYMLYTGGTTGMPKGVMYRQSVFAAQFLSQTPPLLGQAPCSSIDDAVATATRLAQAGISYRAMPACPLMHGSGMWGGLMSPFVVGGACVLTDSVGLDPARLFEAIERDRVASIVIVGDAFARPMVKHLDEQVKAGRNYDLSSLRLIVSSGAMFSAPVKAALFQHVPGAVIVDAMGGSEGSLGSAMATRDAPLQTAKFQLSPTSKVFNAEDREVRPGSGEVGFLAGSGVIPFAYYKDPEKSAKTFREIDGVAYSFLGDQATVEADGSITLLGRGSHCINTAGEKVFPEEVEEALKTHPAVEDSAVFGVPDEDFGERVTALVQLVTGASVGTEDVIAHVKGRLAGYKAPRDVLIVDQIPRTTVGKVDYSAVKELAR